MEAPSVSEGDEANGSPSPELGRRAANELRWLREPLVVREGKAHGQQRRPDLNSTALMVEEALIIEELR